MHAYNTTCGVLMQGSANCGGLGVLDAPGEPDMPPGFARSLSASSGGLGVLDAPREPDMPPGFARSLSASTGRGKGPKHVPNLDEAFCDR